jgi:hypothetical protein
MCQQIVVKVTNIKFNENSFSTGYTRIDRHGEANGRTFRNFQFRTSLKTFHIEYALMFMTCACRHIPSPNGLLGHILRTKFRFSRPNVLFHIRLYKTYIKICIVLKISYRTNSLILHDDSVDPTSKFITAALFVIVKI